jgi:hypothetical protein
MLTVGNASLQESMEMVKELEGLGAEDWQHLLQ